MARLFDAYGVIETNDVSAVRTGRVKAQYPFVGEGDLENGMLLVQDNLRKQIRKPHTGTEMCYLHASEEQLYETHLGRRHWKLGSEQRARIFKLTVGDIFETNAVDKGAYDNKAAVEADLENNIFGIPDSSGLIKLVNNATGTNALSTHCVVLQMIEFVTLPNGNDGIKFVVKQAEKIARLGESALITEFKFDADENSELAEDVIGTIDGTDIALNVPSGTNPSALVANFTTSTGASVLVGTTTQVSGTTENDFTSPVTYTVTSGDATLTQDYVVTVTIEE